jgi:ADP-ribose pyrophosphatase YjhB (NUDIX family)
MYSNPVPVAVALIPCDGKIVGIRRAIPPMEGALALPGGYINSGESFNQALSRECLEETGIAIDASDWRVFHVGDSLSSNRILIFGLCNSSLTKKLEFKSAETLETCLIDDATDLAFPLHKEAVLKFFSMKSEL